ncbi:MAG: nucleotidyltransferase [Candidatus Tritonobacter lacicola]|nr:nucleotidyltransferase [Candidatus Tritonobacter lacicola]
MGVNPDLRDLFKIFNEHGVEYLVVGAYAVIYYTFPRFTKDVDVWVNPTPENARRVFRALAKFGAPLVDVGETDFTDREMVYQIGVEPNRIDIMMGISSSEFPAAWSNRKRSTYGGIPICIIGREDLIQSKIAANRPQDVIDVENLKRI